MILKKLMEERAELEREMNSILESAKKEERAMTDEEMTAFDAAEKKISDIDKTVQAEERARKIAKPEQKREEMVEDEEALENRAFANFVRGIALENRAGEIQLTQGINGKIVPVRIANRIIEAVRDMVPFLQLGDVVSTNGTYSVPVYGEDATNFVNADYVDEGEALVDNVGKFTTIDLTGYVVGALALVSNKLVNNTDVDIVNFIIKRVAQAIAEKLEKEFVLGTEGKIEGITEQTAAVTAASETAVTYDELVELKHSVKQAFRPNCRWVMSPTTYTAICKLKDERGLPYFNESENKILGIEVYESDSMPEMEASAKAIVFADLSGYTIKSPKGIEVSILRERFAERNMLGIMGYAEYDGKVTDTKKIKVLQMAGSASV